MEKFWEGFEKRSVKEKQEPLAAVGAKSMLGSIGGSTLGALGAAGLMKLDKKMSPEELAAYKSHIQKNYARSATSFSGYQPHDILSGFDPEHNRIYHTANPRRGVFAHEMGHSTGFHPASLKTRITKQLYKPGISQVLGVGAPLAMLASGNPTAEKMAPYAGVAAISPQLFEEGRASLNALHNIRKLHGIGGALRAAPGLAGAFSTYLAAGAIPGYFAKKYVEKKQKSVVKK